MSLPFLTSLAADLAARAPALAQDARLNAATVIEGLIWSALTTEMERSPGGSTASSTAS